VSIQPTIHDDYFTQQGCARLAMAMLRHCLDTLIADPELNTHEARLEAAWLRDVDGRRGATATVADVFGALGIGGWEDKFANLALQDPARMRQRLRGLGKVFDYQHVTPSWERSASATSAVAAPVDAAGEVGGLEDAQDTVEAVDASTPGTPLLAQLAPRWQQLLLDLDESDELDDPGRPVDDARRSSERMRA
jgi:hypothetical protein